MAKENVFIVLTHKNSLKRGSKTEWEIQETVEFVNQLRPRHYEMSSAIGEYLEKKIITGFRFGIDTYDKLENYVRDKYPSQMAQLESAYYDHQVKPESNPEVMVDEFGNIRPKTVFDHT